MPECPVQRKQDSHKQNRRPCNQLDEGRRHDLSYGDPRSQPSSDQYRDNGESR
jgi:hypothetical protein